MKKIVQTGNWNGEPIWREQTAEETLLDALCNCTHDTPCKFHYQDQLKANLSWI